MGVKPDRFTPAAAAHNALAAGRPRGFPDYRPASPLSSRETPQQSAGVSCQCEARSAGRQNGAPVGRSPEPSTSLRVNLSPSKDEHVERREG